ncbi:MAG TPA: PilZ domain-containing protein [Acidobacteriota bacterium]|nr:PilZ domain-containing protein [Acidobacteriota bacterium]HQM62186.1 PilZ domain-containing protein [Acidobacteriota bacterium]
MENNQRRSKRVRTNFYMKLKGVDVHGKYFEEVVQTANLSKTGALFVTERDLEVGTNVFLSIPLPSTVVRIEKFENSREKKYAVYFKPYHPEEEEKK